jgi:hypothetical protein
MTDTGGYAVSALGEAAKQCAVCHQAAVGQCITIAGKLYHANCFKCARCQVQLFVIVAAAAVFGFTCLLIDA